MNRLEIIVETLEDALAAERGGATQLDLKAHYPSGGITPSHGTVVTIQQQVKIPVVMMIRPHARTFQLTPGDIAIASEDIQFGRSQGVQNFMFGCLTADGKLDGQAIQELHKAAGDCRIHMHLAWELCDDPWQALQDVLDMGFSSIHTGGLTTAKKAIGGSALDASANIRKIAEIVGNRMDIFLAGSVSAENAVALMQATNISNLHSGRGVRTPSTFEGNVDFEKVNALRQTQMSYLSK